MQTFSYHTHTNTLGIYDGQNSAEEMIKRAEEIGYTEIGISNHMCYHPNMIATHAMYFNDYSKFEDAMRRTVDSLKNTVSKASIPVAIGFEVDFFPSSEWRDAFEKVREKLGVDYYIGSTHFLIGDSEKEISSIYYPEGIGPKLTKEFLELGVKNYWQNIVSAIESGYFEFIAHLDVLKLFDHLRDINCDEGKLKVIEALAKHNHAYELNTSGWNKIGEQHPDIEMLKELNKRNVPVVINDDAHRTIQLGGRHAQAEILLESIGYKNRWSFKK